MKQYIENMDTEIRCGYEVSALIKKVWNIQLNMADKLISVCRKHGLQVWGVSGTALGAVRHKGFIPWDDDMDFIMKRKDYDKLVSIASEEFKAPYFFQTIYSDKGFCEGFAKIRYDNTTMMLPFETSGTRAYHMGLYIDIFVMDELPCNSRDLDSIIKLRKRAINYHYIRNSKYFWLFPDQLLIFIKNGLELGSKAFWSQNKLFEYLEDKARRMSNNGNGKITTFMFEYHPKWIREERWFDETLWMPFERMEIPIPAGYDEMLKREYGDYMVMRKSGALHTTQIMDPDRDYSDYKKNISSQYLKLLKKSFKNLRYFLKH